MKEKRNSSIIELNGDTLLYCKLFHHKPNDMLDIMEPDFEDEDISFGDFLDQQVEKFIDLVDEDTCDYFWKSMIEHAYKRLQERDDDYGREVLRELLYK